MFVEPALHCLKNVLVLPSGDPSLLAGGAVEFDGATPAGVCPVAEVVLTFDDGPERAGPAMRPTTKKVARTHSEARISSTAFVLGRAARPIHFPRWCSGK